MAATLKVRGVTTIHLGPMLPSASCNLPERRAGKALKAGLLAAPIRSCSRWGLPCRPCYQEARWALTPPFHPCPANISAHCPPWAESRITGGAVCFLWHFPWGRPRRALPGTVFPRSPDFPLHGHPALAILDTKPRPNCPRAAVRPAGPSYKGIHEPKRNGLPPYPFRKMRFTLSQYADEILFMRFAWWPALYFRIAPQVLPPPRRKASPRYFIPYLMLFSG